MNPTPPNGSVTRHEWTAGAFLIVATLTLLVSGWSGGDIMYALIHKPLWRPIATLAGVGIGTYLLRRFAIFMVGVIFDPTPGFVSEK